MGSEHSFKNLSRQVAKNISRFFFLLPFFLLLKVIYSSVVECPKWTHTTAKASPRHCTRCISVPKADSLPHGQGFYYSSHPCQEKLPTLQKAKALQMCSVAVGPGIWERTDPQWSPVTEEKDEIYERAAWLQRHLLVLLEIRSLYLASIPLHLCTANCCCCSSSLEQRGRNHN